LMYGRSFEVPDDPDYIVPLGKASVVREGTDATIVTFSLAVGKALEAADRLASEGVNVEVIDLRTLRPLDIDTIVASIQKTNRIVTVEEGWPQSGIGAEIAAQVMTHAFDFLDAPLERVTGKDVPLPYAANLERLAIPQVDDITAAIRKVCYKN
jgi:pyruvate dehydrogenase E1 component beta subunit